MTDSGHWHDLESARTCPDHCIPVAWLDAIEERAGWAYHDCRHDDRTCPAERCIRARAEVRDHTHRTDRPLPAPPGGTATGHVDH